MGAAGERSSRSRPGAQYVLKLAVSHPAVTCAIPATSKVKHMEDYMAAGFGPMPDAAARERMVRFVETV